MKRAKAAWNKSDVGKAARKAWKKTDKGKASKAAWYETEVGQACTQRELAAQRAKSLDYYLNRRFVALDSEGRCPLHMIDDKGRPPLEAYKETGFVSKYLTKDSSGHYWEPHELSLIGAASIDRPYGMPIEKGTWEPPVWAEIKPNGQSEQCFEFLLSLPDQYNDEKGEEDRAGPGAGCLDPPVTGRGRRGKPPLYIMFSAHTMGHVASGHAIRFNFYMDAPFYALPYRLSESTILYPRMSSGYYIRDDVLNAIDWCRKFKVPIDKALIVEEANFFHPAENAGCPFVLLADIYAKRI